MQKILSGLAALLLSASALAQEAMLLVYQVAEQGAAPYVTRILITPDHVRMDEGAESATFTLFDRNAELLYNVSFRDKTVLVMKPAVEVLPENKALVMTHSEQTDAEAPDIVGVKPVNVELLANGESCTQLVALPGVMPAATAALRELKSTLARVQAASVASRPFDLQEPCDLATNIYGATRTFEFGLPILERDAGRMQRLADMAEQFAAEDSLFQIPEGLRRIELSELPPL